MKGELLLRWGVWGSDTEGVKGTFCVEISQKRWKKSFSRGGRRKRWVENDPNNIKKRERESNFLSTLHLWNSSPYSRYWLYFTTLILLSYYRRWGHLCRGCVSPAGAAWHPCCFAVRQGGRGTMTSSATRTNWSPVTSRNHRRVAWWKRSVCENEDIWGRRQRIVEPCFRCCLHSHYRQLGWFWFYSDRYLGEHRQLQQ